MKTIKLSFLLVVLFLGTTMKAQTTTPASKPVPGWMVEATTLKKERAIKDLSLSEADAAKFYDLSLQSVISTSERMSVATTDEEKKAIRFDETKLLKKKIAASFPGELGTKISTWNAGYWEKYLKK